MIPFTKKIRFHYGEATPGFKPLTCREVEAISRSLLTSWRPSLDTKAKKRGQSWRSKTILKELNSIFMQVIIFLPWNQCDLWSHELKTINCSRNQWASQRCFCECNSEKTEAIQMLPPITNRTQPISCSRALPLNYWVAWNPPHLSKLALTGKDSQLTSGWTFRTHVFPVFRTRVMESLEVPYKQPLYSPNSISFLLWMKFSMVSRDTKKYSFPFVSWLLMCLEVSKGIENWIIDFS